MDLQAELKIAIEAVKRAAQLTKNVQDNLIDADSVEKKDRSPVTIADLGTQALVNLAVRAAFPEDALIGEEDSKILRENADLCAKVLALVAGEIPGTTESTMLNAIDMGAGETDYQKRYWTLDPIDGTKGFMRGDQYAIALALVIDGEVKLGVLGCPNYPLDAADPTKKGAIFYAVAGEGSFELPLSTDSPKRIRVDGHTDGEHARFCESVEAAHADHDTHAAISQHVGITAEPYRIDSQCKYAAVARGDASIYLRLPRSLTYREKIWDHAAGVIVVKEAGGKVSDFSGNELNFALGRKLEENIGILATNGSLHANVLSAISETVALTE